MSVISLLWSNMLLQENNPRQGGVPWPDRMQSYRYHPEVDFPMTAHTDAFYSSYTTATYQRLRFRSIYKRRIILCIHL